MQIRTTGDLRAFLGEILVGIRDETIDRDQASSIAKVASQINLSLSVEVNAAIQLKKLGEGNQIAGAMLLTSDVADTNKPALPNTDQDGLIWCEQCDGRVEPKDAAACKSKYCSLKKVA